MLFLLPKPHVAHMRLGRKLYARFYTRFPGSTHRKELAKRQRDAPPITVLLKSSSISKLQLHLAFSHPLQTRWTSSKLVGNLDIEAALRRSHRSRAEALRTSLSVLAICAARSV